MMFHNRNVKMEVLNMMKEEKSQAVIVRHSCMRKTGERIRASADMAFNTLANRIMSEVALWKLPWWLAKWNVQRKMYFSIGKLS